MDQTSFTRRFEAFLADCAALIAQQAPGERVACLLVCGSFAAGEGSVMFEGGRPVFLSDLDLVLVVDDLRAHGRLHPRRRAIAESCEKLFPQARFEGRVDLGVLLSGELSSMQLSPGVYDMRRRGRVLYGDPALLETLPGTAASGIGAEAARLLCENRIAALLAEAPGLQAADRERSPGFFYAIARVYTDIATALMCSAGEYRPGYAQRRLFIESQPGGARLREILGERLVGLIGEWTAFKLCPAIDPAAASGRSPGELWSDAARDILWAWRRMAAVAEGRDPEQADEASLEELLVPSRGAGTRETLRSWKTWIRERRPGARLGAFATALACARSGVPQELVRQEAVRLLAAASAGACCGRVRGARGGFPHRGGDWSTAARATSAAWKKLVYGGEV